MKNLENMLKQYKDMWEYESFVESAKSIFKYIKDEIGATAGYVALLSETGEENEVLF